MIVGNNVFHNVCSLIARNQSLGFAGKLLRDQYSRVSREKKAASSIALRRGFVAELLVGRYIQPWIR